MTTARTRTAARPVAAEAPAAAARQAERPTHTADGRVIAYNRKGEPVSRMQSTNGVDQYALPGDLPPTGWSWEWKRVEVVNKTDPQYAAELTNNGWEPVLAESYPGRFMPADYKGPIMRNGLMLMERDINLTIEAMAQDQMRARDKVQVSRRSRKLGTEGAHGVTTDHHGVQQNTFVRVARDGGTGLPTPNYDHVRQPID